MGLSEPEPLFRSTDTLQEVIAPVFGSGGPRIEDVVQGQIANCPVAAVMVAMAHTVPGNLQGMITKNSSVDVFSKRKADEIFRHWTFNLYEVTFPRRSSAVQISGLLYQNAAGRLAFAHSPNGENRVLWPSLIEKAYAVWRGRGSYNRLNDTTSLTPPPDAVEVMTDLVGVPDVADLVHNTFTSAAGQQRALTPQDIHNMLAAAGTRPTVAASLDQNIPLANIVPFHGYAVLGLSGGSVELRNPHGGANADVTLTFPEFRSAFKAVVQVPAATGSRRGPRPAQTQSAEAVIAAAGLGWDVVKEVIHGQGGVTYDKVQMRGIKYPWDEPDWYNHLNFSSGQRIDAGSWYQSWQGDKIGIWFDLYWKYNKHGVGNIELIKRRVEGAWTKWNLRVESSLLPDAVTYEGNFGHCSAVRLTNVYEWSHWSHDSKILRETIVMYGDGDFAHSKEWTQS